MTVKESILRNLEALTPRDLLKVDSFIFRLSPAARREQAELWESVRGILDEETGEAFEQAVNSTQPDYHG